jgi:hypothetical protein
LRLRRGLRATIFGGVGMELISACKGCCSNLYLGVVAHWGHEWFGMSKQSASASSPISASI